jgi:hypothetical protein
VLIRTSDRARRHAPLSDSRAGGGSVVRRRSGSGDRACVRDRKRTGTPAPAVRLRRGRRPALPGPYTPSAADRVSPPLPRRSEPRDGALGEPGPGRTADSSWTSPFRSQRPRPYWCRAPVTATTRSSPRVARGCCEATGPKPSTRSDRPLALHNRWVTQLRAACQVKPPKKPPGRAALEAEARPVRPASILTSEDMLRTHAGSHPDAWPAWAAHPGARHYLVPYTASSLIAICPPVWPPSFGRSAMTRT